MAAMIDTFISVTIPVFFFQRAHKSSSHSENAKNANSANDNMQSSATNDITMCLKHPEIYPLFLSFGERSYAPEDILCYNLVEQFKNSSQRNRKKIVCTLCDTYLKHAAPLQLNLSNQDVEKLAPIFEMQQKILEENKQRFSMSTLSRGIEIPSNFLDNLQQMSERNLVDLYERFYEAHRKLLKDKLGIVGKTNRREECLLRSNERAWVNWTVVIPWSSLTQYSVHSHERDIIHDVIPLYS